MKTASPYPTLFYTEHHLTPLCLHFTLFFCLRNAEKNAVSTSTDNDRSMSALIVDFMKEALKMRDVSIGL